jgi:superfamily I DNA/RNA helicase
MTDLSLADLESPQRGFKPTPEQQAIMDAVATSNESIMVDALAGCSKTTTLELCGPLIKSPSVLALAFNVKIKKELERRFPPGFQVMTLNGLGHRAWMRTLSGKSIRLEEKKLSKTINEVCKENGVKPTSEEWDTLRQLVQAAMNAGLIPNVFKSYYNASLWPDEPIAWKDLAEERFIEAQPASLDLARQVLIQSIRKSFEGEISFDDQIYMPTLFGGAYQRYACVVVDEAQDLSPLNHIQLRRVAADRLIVVGDPRQAIYAFRGADSASMTKIRKLRERWIDLKLTQTFRVPQVGVTRQLNHVPLFKAYHTNKVGSIHEWNKREDPTTGERLAWKWDEVTKLQGYSQRSIYVICRNNAPLMGLAFKLIRQRVGVQILGREIGKSLIALSRKIIPADETPSPECAKLIYDWAQHEIQLLLANGKDEKVAGVTDRSECLIAVIEAAQARNAGEMRQELASLFARESGLVVLGTGHKMKGLEADLVIHLDPWRIPSRYAREALKHNNPAPMEQELNLRYVIETRFKDVLILANLEDFE